MKLKYPIKENNIDKSINTILMNELHISTRLLTKLIKKQKIFINKNKVALSNKYRKDTKVGGFISATMNFTTTG